MIHSTFTAAILLAASLASAGAAILTAAIHGPDPDHGSTPIGPAGGKEPTSC